MPPRCDLARAGDARGDAREPGELNPSQKSSDPRPAPMLHTTNYVWFVFLQTDQSSAYLGALVGPLHQRTPTVAPGPPQKMSKSFATAALLVAMGERNEKPVKVKEENMLLLSMCSVTP